MNNPVLEYIEFNITDHCNMKCKGCALFAPIAPIKNISLTQLNKDLERLSELFSNIKLIRFIGGEPLLNKEITDVIKITRRFFPNSDVRILTNGTLLNSMSKVFWDTLKLNNIGIDITLYPKFHNLENDYLELSRNKDVDIIVRKKYVFKKFISNKKCDNYKEIFESCSFKVSTFLRDGKISACHMPLMAHIFNNYFNRNLSTNGFIDIYSSNINGEDVIEFLKNPTESCGSCCIERPKFDWEESSPEVSHWCNELECL